MSFSGLQEGIRIVRGLGFRVLNGQEDSVDRSLDNWGYCMAFGVV